MWDRLKPALFKPGIPLPIQRTTSTIGIGMTERVEDSSPYPTWSEEQHKAAIVILTPIALVVAQHRGNLPAAGGEFPA
jgi:hypothetical protein